MAGKKSPASHWCLFRTSETVRMAIKVKLKYQKEIHGKSMYKVCNEAKIDLSRLSRYLHGTTPSLSQYQLMKLCRFLGINVDVDVSFFSSSDNDV